MYFASLLCHSDTFLFFAQCLMLQQGSYPKMNFFPSGPLRANFVVCGNDGAFFSAPEHVFAAEAPKIGAIPMDCDDDMLCHESLSEWPPSPPQEQPVPSLSLGATAFTIKLPSILRRKKPYLGKSMPRTAIIQQRPPPLNLNDRRRDA
jgi:hypothetical protein